MFSKIIVVNATAPRIGGTLTILKQFIEAVPADEYTYIVFVDESVQLEVPSNVKLVPLNKRSFLKRFIWDAFGVKKWLKIRRIVPIVTISLQNTNFRVNTECPNYIYYHQPLPFYPYKWSLLKSRERILWFYKHIYPVFVKLFINGKTEVFVQLQYIKEAFAKKYPVKKEKIHVVFPKVERVKALQKSVVVIDEQKTNLFYPASSVFYKNHKILLEAFVTIDAVLSKKMVLYLTCNKDDISVQHLYQNIEIVYLEQLSHGAVIELLHEVDGCVFPSYIETLGLPLIEAAGCGTQIIAADLPYAKEVLDGFDGVTFVNHRDAKAWGNEILKLNRNSRRKFEPFHRENTASWNDFFKIIKQNV